MVKNKLQTKIKNAEEQIQNKNREIRELVKSNEKYKSENLTYASITANIKEQRRMDHTRNWVDNECENRKNDSERHSSHNEDGESSEIGRDGDPHLNRTDQQNKMSFDTINYI